MGTSSMQKQHLGWEPLGRNDAWGRGQGHERAPMGVDETPWEHPWPGPDDQESRYSRSVRSDLARITRCRGRIKSVGGRIIHSSLSHFRTWRIGST